MMMPETLLDVQLALLHMVVNRENFLQHWWNCQLHRAHASLKCNQSLQYLSIASILLWRWRSSLRRGYHIRYCYMNMRRLWIIILIISSQLGIRLHQHLLGNGVLDLHRGLASDTDAWLQNDLSEQAAKGKTGISLITGLQDNSQNMLAQEEGQA
jgi:hypothetical protein